jgi:uncharacterized protein with HEPN domain
MSKRALERLEVILAKIEMIEQIVAKFDFVSKALEDEVMAKPAIMMHLTAIAEQFSKLEDSEIINAFDQNDIKGAIATRNFIAHDYDGINLGLIETIIRERLPIVKKVIQRVLG